MRIDSVLIYFKPDISITLVSLPAFIKEWNLFQILLIIFTLTFQICNIYVTFVWHISLNSNLSKAGIRYFLYIGRVNQKIEPPSGLLETPTSPLRLFIRFLTIAKPNPLPLFSEALAEAVL